MNKIKHVLWIIFRIVRGPLILVALLLLGTFLSSAISRAVALRKLNNTYINVGYKGWQEVSLDERTMIKLPANWELREEDERCALLCDGKTMASGFSTIWDITRTIERNWFRDVWGKQREVDSAIVAWENLPDDVKGALGTVTIQGNSVLGFYIQLHPRHNYGGDRAYFLFSHDDSEEIREYLEAIVCSINVK